MLLAKAIALLTPWLKPAKARQIKLLAL